MIGRFVACAAICVAASSATADLVNPLVPDWAGDATANTYQWDSFTSAYQGPNSSDAGFAGPQLFNFGEGAFIASSGNIYNPSGGLNIHVYGSGPIGQAVLNFATAGSEFNYSNVRLFVSDGEDGSGNSEMLFASGEERNRESGGFGGANVTMAYSWDVDVDFEVASWGFFFGSDNAHSSLDAVSLAINSVPAPGALMALGCLGFARRRRN